MRQLICQAIQEQRHLEFYYGGYRRVVEPHCHGVTTAGNEVLRGFQFAGSSKSGNSFQAKLFEVAKMSRIKLLNSTFQNPHKNYRKNDSAMQTIHCQLDH